MNITLLMDNLASWYYPHAQALQKSLIERGHEAALVHTTEEVRVGDMAFFLSCEKIIKKEIRDRNRLSLVAHSSDLPKGKGWSPLTWAILEGKSAVTNTLFEAVDKVDAGKIYLQNTMRFAGHELLPELHAIQGTKINELVLEFVEQYSAITCREQRGEESFYRKRTPEDSELDPNKTIAEQFNLLRVTDNEKYPAFLRYRGKKYILKIDKGEL